MFLHSRGRRHAGRKRPSRAQTGFEEFSASRWMPLLWEVPISSQPGSSNRQPAAATGFPRQKNEKKCSGPWLRRPPSRFSTTTTFDQPLVVLLWNPPSDKSKSNARTPGSLAPRTHTRRTDVRTDDGIFLIDGKVASPRVQTLARKRQASQKPSLSSLCADDLPSSQLRRAEFLLRPILGFSRPRLPAKRFSRRAESESTSQSQGARARSVDILRLSSCRKTHLRLYPSGTTQPALLNQVSQHVPLRQLPANIWQVCVVAGNSCRYRLTKGNDQRLATSTIAAGGGRLEETSHFSTHPTTIRTESTHHASMPAGGFSLTRAKLRPTTGELPCRVSRRIAAWMAQMVVSIDVARLLLSPPQYPPMHHAQAERRTAHGTARMGPCRHAFPRQSLLHSITKFTPRALVVDQEPSSSAFFSSEAAGSIPRTQPLAPSWLETRDMTA